MPTYEYKCTECSYTFEEYQSMKAEPLRTCPSCKKEGLKRIMGGGGGMIFKGQGFYHTDYRKSGGNSKGEGKTSSSGAKAAKPSEPPKTDSPKKDDSSKPSSPPSDKKS